MQRYNPNDIEPKWQQRWADSKIYEAKDGTGKPKRYVLEFFPYPSGAAMHVGHVRNYTIGDAISRHARMRGFEVLHPMGWDAFGLPAENYAIKTGISPKQAIADNTGRFKEQLTKMGFGYDWSREFASSDPDYYRWTQWFFQLLFKRGLAYQKESLQWWCPVDKTVLANEQVEAGKCWRCGSDVEKKALKQWFFKITDYADRLAQDLDDVNWTDSIKNMQRNWIGRSKGAEIEFAIDGSNEKLTVFTTRPDTLYGATFMVVAPEHPIVKKIATAEHREHVGNYVKAAEAKSDVERQETNREKTGVFTGAYAVNPVNGQKIPVWVADYVLYGYGTGAIMAVPAHDERDFAFAEKFKLPVRQVVAQEFVDEASPPQAGEPFKERVAVQCIVKHPTEEKYLLLQLLQWKTPTFCLPMGGIDDGEDAMAAGLRELEEETGFNDTAEPQVIGQPYFARFYHEGKKENRRARIFTVAMRLKSLQQNEVSAEERAIQSVAWVSADELRAKVSGEGCRQIVGEYLDGGVAFHGEGVMVNSGPYDDMPASEAREKIVADLAQKGFGKERINYKIRDWLISRQRYWGAPIPMIHCAKDGVVPVPEDQLPVVLPDMDSYEPSGDGRSPLARVPEFVNTTCPPCGGPATRETDTLDGFACSSWYFLRFADPHNSAKAFDADKATYWLPVDDYIGGTEHAVMHLLYARMWTKAMQDAGLISFNEPFKTLRNQGMILAPDGQKMSKSKGNTIEPDVLIKDGYGADAIRIMELFIGPWNQSAAWSVEGMGGSFRFLQRVWALVQEFNETHDAGETSNAQDIQKATHLAIKTVSDDMQTLGFNTAIAALMEFTNTLYKLKAQDHFANRQEWKFALESLLQLLAPFAPHITEELWEQLGHDGSIHISDWPKHDETYLVSDTVTIVVQVNGKLRAQLDVPASYGETETVKAAESNEKIVVALQGKSVRKAVYVPGKLVNFVV